MPRTKLVSWRGPDPERVDAAAYRLGEDSLSAHGTSVTAEYTMAFRLTTGPGWVTRELAVETRGDGWSRSLRLRRSHGGEWETDDGPVADVAGALDCDLGLCLVTNSTPLLRHDLIGAAHRGEAASFDFVMAWVSVPDLEVHRSAQRYTAGDPIDEGGATVGFTSERFRTTLEVDADGVVVNYPGLGRMV